MAGMEDRAQALKDFTGGMNNVADLSAIADNELALILNMELDSNGALVSRPPFTRFADSPTGFGAAGSKSDFVGYFNRSDGVSLLVLATATATYLLNPNTKAYQKVADIPASDITQYQNRLYIVSKTAAGGWWGESTAESGVYTWNSLATGDKPMPKGDQIVLYKERLWISGWGSSDNRTKIYLSEVTNTVGGSIDNFPPLNFLYVGRGDGQRITKLWAGPNELSIFRNNSAYYFSYDSDPQLGTLRRYDGNVGADNRDCVTIYQNYVYVLNSGGLYQLVGFQFYRRNDPTKMQFMARANTGTYSVNTSIGVVGDRILVWFRGNQYSYDLTTQTWSQWESSLNVATIRQIPRAENYFGPEVAYGVAGIDGSAYTGIYRLVNAIDAVNMEKFVCKIRTKGYDYSTPDRYKTLFWWTADVLATGEITGTAVPIVLAAQTLTYDDLDQVTYDKLDEGTYDYLLLKTTTVITNRTSPANYPYRISVKFLKKMRFRRVYYEVVLNSDGSLSTSPAHIFGLVTYADVKQKITKGIT